MAALIANFPLVDKGHSLNYHQMMLYVSNLMCVYFQKWRKLPKFLWNIHLTSTCIYEFSIAVFKTSRLPNPTYHCELIYIKRVTKKQKLQNYLWMMIYVFHFSFFLVVLKIDKNYQNTSDTFIKQICAYMNFQLLCSN